MKDGLTHPQIIRTKGVERETETRTWTKPRKTKEPEAEAGGRQGKRESDTKTKKEGGKKAQRWKWNEPFAFGYVRENRERIEG